MLDIKYIREHPDQVAQNAKNKGYEVDVAQILELDSKRRDLVGLTEDLRAKRNELAKGGLPSEEEIAAGKELRERIAEAEHQLASSGARLRTPTYCERRDCRPSHIYGFRRRTI